MPKAVILEDNASVLLLASDVFELDGYEVAGFRTSDDALRHLEASNGMVDVLFADVRVPGRIDGVALAREAAARWPRIRVVLTSGLDDYGSLRALPEGAMFVTKPWDPLKVLEMAEA